ncbi:MAG: hypothetical protein C7N36_21705 [Bacteroidetes bacterium]|nr:MAG: hypothetical protein C7N36_21705 [Bacteroidota bacterium]
MTDRISLPLSAINEDFLQKLRTQYGEHARLDIQVVEMDETPSLSAAAFWHVMTLLHPDAELWEARIAAAVDYLANLPIKQIYQFEDMLAEKLFALDTAAHAQVAFPEGEHLSVDGFLYVRAAVVARGQAHYQDVLENPALLDMEEDFEPLLSLAAQAYEQKTGRAFDYVAPVDYETYANQAGWG